MRCVVAGYSRKYSKVDLKKIVCDDVSWIQLA
jgi:hypothetical protein